jgi:hypothetical protein
VPAEYYERLGVDSGASRSEIKAAFRERIKETHPDVSDDKAASDQTKRLIEAKNVLTDPDERDRYDRLGHEAYVGTGSTADQQTDSTDSTSDSETDADTASNTGTESGRTAADSTANSNHTSSRKQTEQSWEQEETASTTNSGSTNWYDTSRRTQSTASADGVHHAWEKDRSYAVGDTPGMFSLRELFTSQRTIALLGTAFIIYPVLLFGALFRPFPTAVNLTVGMCIVLVIVFLQSVPQVGIFVFGIWTVLVPILLFGVVGVGVFSLQGILSLAAVSFPFGLSVLTWVALGNTAR